MFGIKTKKDKRIEELEMALSMATMKQPRIYQQTAHIETIAAKQVLEEGMPVEYAKREIARKFIEELTSNITYDIEDLNGQYIISGYLNYVID